jgi:hypothetical protein
MLMARIKAMGEVQRIFFLIVRFFFFVFDHAALQYNHATKKF